WCTTRPATAESPTTNAGSVAVDEPPPPEPPRDWDDAPPPYEGDWYEEAPPPDEGWATGPKQVNAPARVLEPDDPELIVRTLRRSLAAVDGHAASEVSALVGRLLAAEDILDELDDHTRRAWVSALEAVSFECSLLEGVGTVNLA